MAQLREALEAARAALDNRDAASNTLREAMQGHDNAQAELQARLAELHQALNDAQSATA